MAAVIVRPQENQLMHRRLFACMYRNTLRGAAGGCVPTVELLLARGQTV